MFIVKKVKNWVQYFPIVVMLTNLKFGVFEHIYL